MARKSTSKSGKANSGDFGVDFVSLRLSDADKAHLAEQAPSADDIVSSIVRCAEEGYKVSLSYVERSDSYVASLTTPINPDNGRKAALSGFGPTPDSALMCLFYKHYHIGNDGAWALAVDGKDSFGAFG